MSPSLTALSDEVRRCLAEPTLIRPAVVAAGRARVADHDWPEALAVADAVLGRFRLARLSASACGRTL